MKLVMDEKLKHRLIGLAVIISLGAIFAPAMMKKSSQKLDGNLSVNVQLPPKPIVPNVAVTDEKELFKTIKIARAEIPDVSDRKQLPELVKAEPVNSQDIISNNTPELASETRAVDKSQTMELAVNDAPNHRATKNRELALKSVTSSVKTTANMPKAVTKRLVAVIKPAKVTKIAKVTKKPVISKTVYAVQLASLSRLSNAQALVSRLRSKGYKANFIKVATQNGPVYKVYAGHSPRKNEVVKLKTQLASAMQLNGFVVNTGVS